MQIRKFLSAVAFIVMALGLAGASAQLEAKPKVKLILQITIDGLRGDLLERYSARFGSGGFRYLLENGVVYTNTNYQHANTETIVGHTTLATGAFPAQHGMVGNVWFDRETDELSYNIEDPDHPLLPSRKQEVHATQLDPSQKTSRTNGRSPVSILASTFSDELASHTAGQAKIFAVAGKDRSAVSMAGHAGKAFWFSTDNGDYVTSSFYYDDYPTWAKDWNDRREAETYANKSWSLLHPQSDYLLADFDDRPYETDLKGYGRTFPHPFGAANSKLFNTLLFISPVGDRLTNNFAKALIENEGLGRDDVTDYLAVGFSSVDAVNHFFGPSSLENEDIVLQLDRTLADLFSFVDKLVGLDNTLIVLSADHGMAEMPEAMSERGLPARRIHTEDIVKAANDATSRKFGFTDAVNRFFRPYLYLNKRAIKLAKLDEAVVAQTIADALTAMDGIALAVSSATLAQMQDTPVLKQIRNNYHPLRSGDIYVVQEPYWFLFEKGPIAVMHGSPWRYDTHVPIIFNGPGIESAKLYHKIHPADIAPTLAAYMGTKYPSSSVGNPLLHVLSQSK